MKGARGSLAAGRALPNTDAARRHAPSRRSGRVVGTPASRWVAATIFAVLAAHLVSCTDSATTNRPVAVNASAPAPALPRGDSQGSRLPEPGTPTTPPSPSVPCVILSEDLCRSGTAIALRPRPNTAERLVVAFNLPAKTTIRAPYSGVVEAEVDTLAASGRPYAISSVSDVCAAFSGRTGTTYHIRFASPVTLTFSGRSLAATSASPEVGRYGSADESEELGSTTTESSFPWQGLQGFNAFVEISRADSGGWWSYDESQLREVFPSAFSRPISRITSDIPRLVGGPIWVNPDATVGILGQRCENVSCLPVPTAERQALPVLGVTAPVWAAGQVVPCPGGAPPPGPVGSAQQDGSIAYNLTDVGLPLRVVAPPGWQLLAGSIERGTALLVPRERSATVLELGVIVASASTDRFPGVLTSEDVIAQLIRESGGAYERVAPSPQYDLPSGFDATALLRVKRSFNIAGADPGRFLNNWQGAEGSTLRIVVSKGRERTVIAYLEASDWSGADALLPYLSQVRVLPD